MIILYIDLLERRLVSGPEPKSLILDHQKKGNLPKTTWDEILEIDEVELVQELRRAKRIMKEANLPDDLRLSDLRRTGTVEMVDAGVGIAQIMSVTGHANPQSVKPYMKNTYRSANSALTARKSHGISITSAAKEGDTI